MKKAKKCPQIATTGPDGSYQLEGLPSGQYNLKISANGFYSTKIRDVQIDGRVAKMLPVIRLEFGLMFDCGMDRRPDYYRLLRGGRSRGRGRRGHER